MTERNDMERREPEIVYSRSLKAGKRIYYLDVKKDRKEDLFLCITESKRKSQGEEMYPVFEKHKIFLYKEDFAHFQECMQDVMSYVEQHFGSIEQREEYVPRVEAENADGATLDGVEGQEGADESSAEPEARERRSLFQRLGLKN